MRLLLTNDDGVYAIGIHALAKELSKYHDVTVLAPASQRSGFSHKICVEQPLSLERVQVEGLTCDTFATDGSPADCTRLGLYYLDKEFDAVISGINQGSNLGTDILYSGTCGAAMEAAMHRLPALAVSLCSYNGGNFELAAKTAAKVIESGILSDLPFGITLNLNVPNVADEDLKGVKWVRHGYNHLLENVEKAEDGCVFHGLARQGRAVPFQDDFSAIDQGFASLTALDLDLTNLEQMARLSVKYTF